MEHNGIHFSLPDQFLDKFKGKQPKWGPLGYFTYIRTYSREISPGKREEFWQTLKRVVEGCFLIQKMHCLSLNIPWSSRRAQKSAQEMFQRMWDFKFLPPGRGLWAMGTEFVFKKGAAALNNCAFISTENIKDDFSSPFAWLMDMCLHGVGVGFDTAGANKEVFLKLPRTVDEIFVIEDSREGWVSAFKRVLDAYVGADVLPTSFDYSKIRPKGEPIKGFGGIAPGPGPLMSLIERANKHLHEYAINEKQVDSTLIVDLMNFAGAAIVAGGIRRSSEIAFSTPSDMEFLKLKTQDNVDNPSLARWASNNSVFCEVGQDYTTLAEQTITNGEPGYMWLNNARNYGRFIDGFDPESDRRVKGCNPCGEQPLESYELCCLVETFPCKHKDVDDYITTLKYAYLYAKTVTLLPTHDAKTNAVVLRNRRIGLSQTGIIENITKVGLRAHLMDWCDKGYKAIREWDRIYSEWLCIPESVKVTTVKPSGTVSLLPGVTPGIHYPHSEFYIRRIRVSSNSELWKKMEKAGYEVEKDKYDTNSMVISFPVHEPFFNKRKEDVCIWEQLELAAQMQYYWSDNAVSITVTVPEFNKKDVATALSMYETRLKTVSFLPLEDHKYEQAPYETISEARFNEMALKIKHVKLTVAEEDKKYEVFCDGDKCEVTR